MQCKECGKEIDDDSIFCKFCSATQNGNGDVENRGENKIVDKVAGTAGDVIGSVAEVAVEELKKAMIDTIKDIGKDRKRQRRKEKIVKVISGGKKKGK